MCRPINPHLIKDHHKWAMIQTTKFQLIPRHQRQQDRQRADIEQEHADHGLIYRFRDVLIGVFSFSSRHADQLNATKGKHHKGQHIK